jgi:hypothetical protein
VHENFRLISQFAFRDEVKPANSTEVRSQIYCPLSLSFTMHNTLSPKAIFSSELNLQYLVVANRTDDLHIKKKKKSVSVLKGLSKRQE